MKRPNVVSAISRAIRPLQPFVRTLLYGSEARGGAHLQSDIDLLILVDQK